MNADNSIAQADTKPNLPLMSLTRWLVVGLALAALIAVSLFALRGTGAAPQDNALDFNATLLDGSPVRLSDYRGQIVLLNFWATWCGPCRREMPTLQAAYERYRDRGFTVLAVNYAETPGQIQPFLDSLNVHLPVVLDEDTRLQQQFGIVGYPTSIFIDADGRPYATHYGEIDADTISAYIEAG